MPSSSSPSESHRTHAPQPPVSPSELQIRIGPITTTSARVDVTLAVSPSTGASARYRVEGTLEGPFCRHSRTLQTRVNFRPCDSAEGPSATALMPDPCFWTPDLPHLYRAALTLHESDRVAARFTRWVGFRPIEIVDRRIYFEGRNWVLRAARPPSFDPETLASWRTASLAVILPSTHAADIVAAGASSSHSSHAERDASDANTLLLEASREGIFCVVPLRGDTATLARALWRLNGLPCLALAILEVEGPSAPPPAPEHWPPNILRAQQASWAPRPLGLSPWAQVVVCDVPSAPLPSEPPALALDRLLMACRHIGPLDVDAAAAHRATAANGAAAASQNQTANQVSVANQPQAAADTQAARHAQDARRQCDRLQRDLAGRLDVCGLLIEEMPSETGTRE